jgi:hypothetical protein
VDPPPTALPVLINIKSVAHTVRHKRIRVLSSWGPLKVNADDKNDLWTCRRGLLGGIPLSTLSLLSNPTLWHKIDDDGLVYEQDQTWSGRGEALQRLLHLLSSHPHQLRPSLDLPVNRPVASLTRSAATSEYSQDERTEIPHHINEQIVDQKYTWRGDGCQAGGCSLVSSTRAGWRS